MNELIKITYQNNEPAVSARELHDFLEVGTPYRIWFPRMCEYGFIEGEDFNLYKNVRVEQEGGRTVRRMVEDAVLTLDTAKEICMLQRKRNCGRISSAVILELSPITTDEIRRSFLRIF